MKKIYAVLVLGTILSSGLVASTAQAQDQDTNAAAGMHQGRTPDQVVAALASKLNLTDDQKTQIKPIIEDRQQKLEALRSDPSMRRMQRARKAKSIFEESDKKINAILNDQQKQQYAQLEAQMKQRMRDRRNGGGAEQE